MAEPQIDPSTATADRREVAYRPLVLTGLAAGALAAVATVLVAVVGHAAGVSLDVAGEPIPVPAFAVLTLVGSLLGLALAAVLARRAAQPARTFVRVTVVLLVMSSIPDVLADADVSTKLLLVTTHLVAAAIVIPALARRLA